MEYDDIMDRLHRIHYTMVAAYSDMKDLEKIFYNEGIRDWRFAMTKRKAHLRISINGFDTTLHLYGYRNNPNYKEMIPQIEGVQKLEENIKKEEENEQ